MPSPLPPEIRVERVRDDVCYSLPVRPLGTLRWVGFVPVALTAVFLSIPVTFVIRFLRPFLTNKATHMDHIFVLFFAVFLIPFFVVGLRPLWFGLLVMFGRCRVEWRDKRLSVLDYVGPIRWRRRLSKSRNPIRRLSVTFGGAKINNQPVSFGLLANLASLVAEFDQGKPRMVAMGYPRDWLYPLAEDLSARIGAVFSPTGAPTVELVNTDKNQLHNDQQHEEAVDVAQKPADCQIRVEPSPNGFVLVVPPTGLRQGSKGLLFAGILCCSFITVFTGLLILAPKKNTTPPGLAWLALCTFWTIGFGMIIGAINLARRRGMLRVENGQLKVVQQGLFGTRLREWLPETIVDIRAGDSGLKVNGRSVIELQIHPAAGKKTGLFAGRNEDELRWMASELRRALRIPAAVSAS